MYARVIVDISTSEVDKVFDYQSIDGVERGSRVLVPFGSRLVEGYVIDLVEKTDCPQDKIKPIKSVLDPMPVIADEMFGVMDLMVKRYNITKAAALRLFIPAQMRGGKVKELTRLFAVIEPEYLSKEIDEFIKPSSLAQRELFAHLLKENGEFVSVINRDFSTSACNNLLARGIIKTEPKRIARKPYVGVAESLNLNLTDEQKRAIEAITTAIDSQDKAENKTFLLHGVTGSGKTEVYIRCIDYALKTGRTAIMLVPEISLTPQVFSLFRARFGQTVAILHSGLSAGERFDEWHRLLEGEALVAVGARSAIFAPLKNVGVIIIDEEHDNSYSSESNPRYITSEIAAFRQKFNDCALVFGSATPDVATYYHAQEGDIRLLEMTKRINNSLPKIKIVNMSTEFYEGNNSIFSRELYSRLKECLEQKNQAMLFINRRGYSSFVRCTACGYVAVCDRCDVSLVYHKEDGNLLKCHYCGNRYVMPKICPKCGAEHLRRGYIGTQQVEEKLLELFPNIKIQRMDNDTTQTKDSHVSILEDFKNRKTDVLIGTQMIAKGHDFPLVTLVGIIDADISLHFSDFKSNERTFQLITQVSGRAGRADKEGAVVLQTFSPGHYVYRFAFENDYRAFYKKEINLRQVTSFPPFATVLRILVSGENEQHVAACLKQIYDGMLDLSKEYRQSFPFLSYMRSPVKKIKSLIRMQVLCRITQPFDEILGKVYNITDRAKNRNVFIFVEINPNNLS